MDYPDDFVLKLSFQFRVSLALYDLIGRSGSNILKFYVRLTENALSKAKIPTFAVVINDGVN